MKKRVTRSRRIRETIALVMHPGLAVPPSAEERAQVAEPLRLTNVFAPLRRVEMLDELLDLLCRPDEWIKTRRGPVLILRWTRWTAARVSLMSELCRRAYLIGHTRPPRLVDALMRVQVLGLSRCRPGGRPRGRPRPKKSTDPA
jgi:hypothetical protein